jgi:anti-sigma regulatory factor (Ser/Thr protein kinase)
VHGPASPETKTDAVTAWTQGALDSLGELPGVHRVGLALTEGGGRRLRFTANDRDNRERPDWCHIDAYDDVPLNTAVRTGQPVFGTLDDLDERYARFVSKQRGTPTVALAATPIVAAGQTIGGFVLFFDAPQAFDGGQRLELTQVGAALGDTLRRAQRRQGRAPAALPDQPMAPGGRAAVHDAPGNPASVAEARRFLRRTLDDWGVDQGTSDTAVLCLSELVTNSVVHAHSGCAVRVLLEEEGVLTITVRDRGAPDAASGEPDDEPLQVHGRGLQLVDALATRWGSELDLVGTTVWFVLEPGEPES